MGTDVWSESGIIAFTEEVVKIVNGKNKNKVVEICQSFWENISLEEDSDKKDHFKPLQNISNKSKISEIQEILSSIVNIDGEPSKYNTDIEVRYSYELEDLFGSILALCPDLPELKSITAFGSARLNGYSVPLGVACFIFDSNDCFEQVLTEKGKYLKKVIGHCRETEWTIVSY